MSFQTKFPKLQEETSKALVRSFHCLWKKLPKHLEEASKASENSLKNIWRKLPNLWNEASIATGKSFRSFISLWKSFQNFWKKLPKLTASRSSFQSYCQKLLKFMVEIQKLLFKLSQLLTQYLCHKILKTSGTCFQGIRHQLPIVSEGAFEIPKVFTESFQSICQNLPKYRLEVFNTSSASFQRYLKLLTRAFCRCTQDSKLVILIEAWQKFQRTANQAR